MRYLLKISTVVRGFISCELPSFRGFLVVFNEQRILWILVILVVAVNLTACSAKSSPDNKATQTKHKTLTPKQWAELSQPGVSHKLLDIFVGKWDVKITYWNSPRSQGHQSSGKSDFNWILGGRFLRENFSGQIAGEKFEGMGLMAYDNAERAFKTVWLDSLNTTIATAAGRYSPDSNEFNFTSEVYDPLIGKNKTIRSILRIKSPDSYVFTMFDRSPEGRDYISFETQYSRDKSS